VFWVLSPFQPCTLHRAYADLPTALTIVHYDGTHTLSLHTSYGALEMPQGIRIALSVSLPFMSLDLTSSIANTLSNAVPSPRYLTYGGQLGAAQLHPGQMIVMRMCPWNVCLCKNERKGLGAYIFLVVRDRYLTCHWTQLKRHAIETSDVCSAGKRGGM
jgi:hypothetical protein